MASPDTITIGVNPYPVYGNLADAEVYFGGKLNATSWTAAIDATKNLALVSAARLLNQQNWRGVAVSTTQENLWPRTGVVDRLGEAQTFPQDVVDGFFELAQALIDDPTLAETANLDSNIKRVKADTVEVEFFTELINQSRFANQINELLQPYLAGSGGIVGGLATGNDDCSSFSDQNKFGRSEGFA